MRDRLVQCPSCGRILAAPPGCANCVVRCGVCHTRFRLPRRVAMTDEAIASMLQEEHLRDLYEDLHAPPTGEAKLTGAEEVISGQTAVLPALAEGLRLVRMDRKGATFLFPASRLLEPAFRAAMPRRCLGCSSRMHLRAHVVIFAPELIDSRSLEAEHSAGALVLSEEEIRDLGNDELLNRLPKVPNVPHPGDLPMPYFLCDMCTGTGEIGGQINIHSVTGQGTCRLQIRNLRRAEEFLIQAGGEGTPCHESLRRRIEKTAEHPWDLIPDVVRHRIEQWFRPLPAERFLAYVADRDHARTEDGMFGIVVSNGRMIYHANRRHHEAGLIDPVEVQVAQGSGKESLRLKAPLWEVKHMAVDGEGKSLLRRALTLARFQVTWH